jgi:hypothetical protein
METIKNKTEEKEIKCEICKKRKATEIAAIPLEPIPMNVCTKCFNDILDEE